jgi:GAF domain-containing protein
MGRIKLENQLESLFADLASLDGPAEGAPTAAERKGNGRAVVPARRDPRAAGGGRPQRPRSTRVGAPDRPEPGPVSDPVEQNEALPALEPERLLASLERRALQLETAAEISRAITSTLDLDRLLVQAVELIRERFDLYYVGIFMLDSSGRWAVLKAGTGEAGRQMIVDGHRLAIADQSMIGWSIAQGQARIALQTGDEAIRFENPLLPRTRSEIALPLISRATVLGAMTIQSAEPDAFTPDDTVTLQTMADQLANAIANAQLLEQAESRAEELGTLNAIAGVVSGSLDLAEMLDKTLRMVMTFTGLQVGLYSVLNSHTDRLELACHGNLPATIETRLRERGLGGSLCELTFQQREIVTLENMAVAAPLNVSALIARGLRSYVGVPLKHRDRILGTLCLFGDEDRLPANLDTDLLEAAARQVAVGIANAQLFQETQHALAEAEQAYRRYLSREWEGFLAGTPRARGYIDTPAGLQNGDDFSSPEMVQAVAQGGLVTRGAGSDQAGDGPAALAVPIQLRGQTIGVFDFSHEGHEWTWTKDDEAVVQALADQVALALENARLLEKTERRAHRERLASQLAARIHGAGDTKAILATAAEGLGKALGVSRTLIRLADPLDGSAAQDEQEEEAHR